MQKIINALLYHVLQPLGCFFIGHRGVVSRNEDKGHCLRCHRSYKASFYTKKNGSEYVRWSNQRV